MSWVHVGSKERTFLSPAQQPYFLFLSPPPPSPSSKSSGFNLNNRVSPSMLLIIIILAIIFFVSGLLHLLVRFLLRPPNRDPDETDNVTALQGQLQQLFHLHDAGVDQSFIDTLPVFNYNAIIGVKDPFDCAVCLCEFEGDDKLRLLPKCSHAFHMDCIDTWLLSHSTCPICRASLLNDFSPNNNCSPIVLVLESGSESLREIGSEREVMQSVGRVNSHLSDDVRLDKSCELQVIEDDCSKRGGKVVSVKLGKFKSVEGGGEGSSDATAEARRCFSMSSFAYIMDEKSLLQVPIRTPLKKQTNKKPPLTPGHRLAMSECGCDSRREFNGFEAFQVLESQGGCNESGCVIGSDANAIGRGKKESFSVSKIWLRGKKDMANAATVEQSRRAFSFRNPVPANGRRMVSEMDMSRWVGGGSEVGVDEEVGSCNSLDSQANPPSFARRTLIWLMGRPNKFVHPSFSSNV